MLVFVIGKRVVQVLQQHFYYEFSCFISVNILDVSNVRSQVLSVRLCHDFAVIQKRRGGNAFWHLVDLQRSVAWSGVWEQKTVVSRHFPSWKLLQLTSESAFPWMWFWFTFWSASLSTSCSWRAKLRCNKQGELRQYGIDSYLLFVTQYLQDITSRAFAVNEIKKVNWIKNIVVHRLRNDTFPCVYEII